MASVPTAVTADVGFSQAKHKSVSVRGGRKGVCEWRLQLPSEPGHPWAFSSRRIPRGEKVRLLAKEDSDAFNSNWSVLYPEFAPRKGYFTFIHKNPNKLPQEAINGTAPIEGFDDPSNNLFVKFQGGRIYEFWISPDECRMFCAKVPIEGEGQDVIVDSKIMHHFEGQPGFWLMMRATPGMQLQFLD